MFALELATDTVQNLWSSTKAGKLVVALCHGVAVLYVMPNFPAANTSHRETVTGFANIEEDFADEAVWSMGALPKGKRNALAH